MTIEQQELYWAEQFHEMLNDLQAWHFGDTAVVREIGANEHYRSALGKMRKGQGGLPNYAIGQAIIRLHARIKAREEARNG